MAVIHNHQLLLHRLSGSENGWILKWHLLKKQTKTTENKKKT